MYFPTIKNNTVQKWIIAHIINLAVISINYISCKADMDKYM